MREEDEAVTQEQIEAAQDRHNEIEAEYDAMFDPDNLEYHEGQTIRLLLQARKEFTTRVSSLVSSIGRITDTCVAGNVVFNPWG